MDRNALNVVSTWLYDDRMWYVTSIHCSGYKPRKSAQLLGEESASSHDYSTWGFSYLSWKKRFDYGVVRRAQQLAPLWFAVQLKGQKYVRKASFLPRLEVGHLTSTNTNLTNWHVTQKVHCGAFLKQRTSRSMGQATIFPPLLVQTLEHWMLHLNVCKRWIARWARAQVWGQNLLPFQQYEAHDAQEADSKPQDHNPTWDDLERGQRMEKGHASATTVPGLGCLKDSLGPTLHPNLCH